MRLFIAVDVPQRLKDAIETEMVESLSPKIAGARWTRPEGRHLTLQFLGEVAEERIDGIGEAMGSAAAKHRQFEAAFAELGGFPNARRPRVLWLGIGPGAEELGALAADIGDALEPLGFEKEDRPFRAHFTLARFPTPRVIGELPDADVPTEPFSVDEVVLFRSQLHPKGARYSRISAARLGA